ncbi:hypothetical protein IJT17_04565 [bacterium]|nr:hypothetical protein [bacterium]
MPTDASQPLTSKQLYVGAALALCLSIAGWWFSAPSQDRQSALPDTLPLNRREAERGRAHIFQRHTKDLTYKDDSAAAGQAGVISYVPYGEAPKLALEAGQTMVQKPGQLQRKKLRIINGQANPRDLFRERRDRAALPSADTMPPSQAPQPLASASDYPTNTKKQGRSAQSASVPSRSAALPAAAAEAKAVLLAEQDGDGLIFPPPHISSRIGLPQAWRSSRNSLLYIYDESGTSAEGVCFQVTAEDSIWQADLALSRHERPDSSISPAMASLGLALVPARSRGRGAVLASAPPARHENLATSGLPFEAGTFSNARVTDNLYGGMFSLICPIRPEFAASPLINARGEIAGLVVGTMPEYRGHNHFLGADASLLYAWCQRRTVTGMGKLYDLEFQIADQLESALASLRKRGLNASPPADAGTAIPGQSLGGFRLGASVQEVTAVLGEAYSAQTDLFGYPVKADHPLFSYAAYPGHGLAFNFYDGRLVAIETNNPAYATPAGLGPGADTGTAGFTHELSYGRCSGYTEREHQLWAIQGLEAELNDQGIVELLRITI